MAPVLPLALSPVYHAPCPVSNADHPREYNWRVAPSTPLHSTPLSLLGDARNGHDDDENSFSSPLTLKGDPDSYGDGDGDDSDFDCDCDANVDAEIVGNVMAMAMAMGRSNARVPSIRTIRVSLF
ncbi:hypothetical protein ACLKA6_017369 [Drosophila palustris]